MLSNLHHRHEFSFWKLFRLVLSELTFASFVCSLFMNTNFHNCINYKVLDDAHNDALKLL